MNRDKWGLSKSQRMQLKVFICFLGMLLLLILLLGKLLLLLLHMRDDEDFPLPPIPILRILTNVWVMEMDGEGLTVFQDGEREYYPWAVMGTDEEGHERLYQPEPSAREQVADVILRDGRVSGVVPKLEKINGKILSADDSGVEVEGYGRLPLAKDYKGYRLYDSLEMCTVRDLRFGYNFTDLCMENGEICGVLMAKEEAMEYIRVLIQASDYESSFHTRPVFTCDVGYTVIYGPYDDLKKESYSAGEELAFDMDGEYFEGERVRIVPDVLTGKISLVNCHRSQGTPAYRGQMELLRTEKGIVVINEVLLEEYLYSVVPSEMPSKYPSEALKTQAICARTYAYGHMEQAGFPQYGAHVDDSTTYQVYNNILEQESTTTASKDTYGQLLYTDSGDLAGTFYYSTSCGVGSDSNVWKTKIAPTLTYLKAKALSAPAMEKGNDGGLGEKLKDEDAFSDYIRTVREDDFESEEGWYRWQYRVEELDTEHLLTVLRRRYDANSQLILTWIDGEYVSEEIQSLDEIKDIYVESRGSGGVADELVIETATQKIKVITEHNIRYVLNDGSTKVERQDGSKVSCPSLLPSGFFIMETGKEKGNVVRYALIGGGYGHGVGMSQNGARAMAQAGYKAQEILLYFYEDCVIKNIYE